MALILLMTLEGDHVQRLHSLAMVCKSKMKHPRQWSFGKVAVLLMATSTIDHDDSNCKFVWLPSNQSIISTSEDCFHAFHTYSSWSIALCYSKLHHTNGNIIIHAQRYLHTMPCATQTPRSYKQIQSRGRTSSLVLSNYCLAAILTQSMETSKIMMIAQFQNVKNVSTSSFRTPLRNESDNHSA